MPTASQLKLVPDAKIKLPNEFIRAAAKAIAYNEAEVIKIDDLQGSHEEIKSQRAEISARIEILSAVFTKSGFITTDTDDVDLNNGGKILKLVMNLDKLDIANDQKILVLNAVCEKSIWMGYPLNKDLTNGNIAAINVPAYKK